MSKFMDDIKCPDDLNDLSINDLKSLANEIRSFIIDSVSKTGGHIGTALGVVELTIALHHIFSMPKDTIIYDTGHQGYTHKILTGRKNMFKTLNQFNGMSRFIKRAESKYDIIDASHAGTAISIASGIAFENKLKKKSEYVIAFIGDGALVEGMSAEGLNYCVDKKLPLIIVLNDNGMAIPVNVGGIKNLTSGKDWEEKSKAYFNGLGYKYLAVRNGHDIGLLVDAFKNAKKMYKEGAIVVHVKTEKGKGLSIAKNHKYKMHFSMPFNPKTGEGTSPVPTGKTYASVAGKKLYNLLKNNKDMIVITPSTPYASGLDDCLNDFPERVIDVGMAEQHALGMASGLALRGLKPFVCYQSTFMQRVLDQIIHDVCFMNLPVTILAVRSGFAGMDSPTHHGIYDISYLRGLPNLKIFYPGTSRDLELIIEKRAKNPEGPMVILYPYDKVTDNEIGYYDKSKTIDHAQIIYHGVDGYILSVGNTLNTSFELIKLLKSNNLDFGLVNIRWLKPIPKKQIIDIIKSTKKIITTEENVIEGGFGSSIAELIVDNNLDCEILRSAITQNFVEPGDKIELEKETLIDSKSILRKMMEKWTELFE